MINNKRILAIIPARKHSKGVPGKNMKLLGDKPLIQYSIESALRSTSLSRIVVSSDCEETVAFAKHWVEVPFIRPSKIANDDTPSIEVIKHAIEFYEERDLFFDYICLLQPTSPFRSPDLIDNAIQHLLESDADSLTTIQKVPDKFNPYWAFQQSNGHLVPLISNAPMPFRRQDLPECYYRDGSIYVFKTSLLGQNQILGSKCIGYEVENETDININTQEEWEMAERYVNIYNKQGKSQF